MKNSKIILADEPTGSLDKRNKDKVVEILSQQASQGTLVIVVTHDPYLTKIGNKEDHALKIKKERMSFYEKAVIICALGIGFVGGNAMSSEVEANSVHGEIYYKSLKPGEIHFDAKGNIIKSNLPVDWEISRTAINHSSGRWVYYSDTTCTRKQVILTTIVVSIIVTVQKRKLETLFDQQMQQKEYGPMQVRQEIELTHSHVGTIQPVGIKYPKVYIK